MQCRAFQTGELSEEECEQCEEVTMKDEVDSEYCVNRVCVLLAKLGEFKEAISHNCTIR